MQPRNPDRNFPVFQRKNVSQPGAIYKDSDKLEKNFSQDSLSWRSKTHSKQQNQQPEKEKLDFQGYNFDSQVHCSKNDKFDPKEYSFDSQIHSLKNGKPDLKEYSFDSRVSYSKNGKFDSKEYSFDSQLHYSKNVNHKGGPILRKNEPQWSQEKSQHLNNSKDHLYKETSSRLPASHTNFKKEVSSDIVLKEDITFKSYDSQILPDDTNKIYQSDESNLLDLSNSKSHVDFSILKHQGEKQQEYLSAKKNESLSVTKMLDLTESESHPQSKVHHLFRINQSQKGTSCLYNYPEQTNEIGLENESRFCKGKNLPTGSIWKEIGDELDKLNKRFCLIRGEPGSGESTQIPQYLYEKIKISKHKIIYVQPTKAAAKNLAGKVAEELGVKLGNQIGHQLRPGKPYEGTDPEVIRRADNLFNENTKILFMSKEMLLDKIISGCKESNGKNKLFKNTKAIFLDEIDEGSLFSELILGMLKKTFLVLYPHMKIFLVSATGDAERYKNHFSNCRVIQISRRKFPVQIIYKPMFENNHIDGIIEVLREVIDKKTKRELDFKGHVLVFLSGLEEMKEVEELINDFDNEFTSNYVVHLFHSGVFNNKRLANFDPGDKRTKIFLATKLAESSKIINEVQIVIDSGYDKDSYYDSEKRMTVLEKCWISQTSAQQRVGKAGRTASGICYRLYSEDTFNRLKISKTPEIATVNLDFALLKIIECGLDPFEFPYFEPPQEQVIRDTLKTLNTLGALDGDNKLTTEGKFMAQMSIEPRMSKTIIQACQRGCLEEILIIFAMEIFRRFFFDARLNEKARQESRKNRIEDDGPYQSDPLNFLYIFKMFKKNSSNMDSTRFDNWVKEHYTKIEPFRKVERKISELKTEISIKKRNPEFEKLLEPILKDDTTILDPNYVKTNILKCLTASNPFSLGKYSGFHHLGFVNILSGFLFQAHFTTDQTNHLFPVADIHNKFAIYSGIGDSNGTIYARVVSFVPSSWLDDETIIPSSLRNELRIGLKENYKYDQTHFELPPFAVRKLKNMFREKLDECSNRLEHIDSNNVKFVSLNDTTITFVHLKDNKEGVIQLFNELKKELDHKVAKKTILRNLEDSNLTLIIKGGLVISEILLPNQYTTVFYSVFPPKLEREQVINTLDIEEKDVDYITLNNQGSHTSGYIKFIDKEIAKEFIEKNPQKINEKALEPVYLHSRNSLVFDNYQIQVTFTLSKSKCVAHLLLGDESDPKVIFEKLAKINYIIDGNNVSLEIDEKNSSLFIINNLNPLTDEYILENYFKDLFPNLQKVTVLRDDPRCFSDDDKYKFESLFTKYLSPREIQNMCPTFKHLENGRQTTSVSLPSKNIAQEIVNDYDGKEGVFGTQKLRINIKNNPTLKFSGEIYTIMESKINQKVKEVQENDPEVKIYINNWRKKKSGKEDKLSDSVTNVKTDDNKTIYQIKIISKDTNLSRTIATQFEELIKGEEFYANKHEDKIKLFTVEMKEFYQKYYEWVNKDKKRLGISWDNSIKKLILHSSLPNIILEAKNMIQKALDEDIKIDCIDPRNSSPRRIRDFLASKSAEFFYDKELEFREIGEKIFIKGHPRSIEKLKKMVYSFMIYNQTKSSEPCPICLKEMSDNFCLLYNCAHKFCKQCFVQYVEAEAETETEIPIVSCPKCKEIVTLKDIKELLSIHVIDKIIDRHFQIYLKKYSNIYKNCSTPGCRYIYLVGTESLKCEGCSKPY